MDKGFRVTTPYTRRHQKIQKIPLPHGVFLLVLPSSTRHFPLSPVGAPTAAFSSSVFSRPMDPFQDWWNEYTATCEFCWDPRVLTPIGDQQGTNACMAFSLVTCLNGYLTSCGHFVTLSEQQLADVFRDPGPSVSEITDYIRWCGLLKNEVYPWRLDQTPQDFVMPNPPVSLYRAACRYPHKKNRFEFENTIRIRPISSYFVVTKSYFDWVEEGCQGVFKYLDWEEAQVYDMLTARDHDPFIISHSVVLLGFGVEEGVEFYLVRDSHGTSINNGYQKLTTSAFNEGIFVDWVDRIDPQIRMSFEYQRVLNYRRPPRLPPPPRQVIP